MLRRPRLPPSKLRRANRGASAAAGALCSILVHMVWKNSFMEAARVRIYIDRAADFYAGLDLMRDGTEYRHSSALLAIHSAIAYSDALRIGLGDERLYGDDHREALKSLRRLLRATRLNDESGLPHFEYLLSMKTFVAYSDKRLDRSRVRLISLNAERFANWISKTARHLKLEGWTDDHE